MEQKFLLDCEDRDAIERWKIIALYMLYKRMFSPCSSGAEIKGGANIEW